MSAATTRSGFACRCSKTTPRSRASSDMPAKGGRQGRSTLSVCAAANRANTRRFAANSDYSRFAITDFPTSEKRRRPSLRSWLLAERIMVIGNTEPPRASVQIEATAVRSGEAVVACSEIRSWRSRPEASNCPSSAFVVEQARLSDSAIAGGPILRALSAIARAVDPRLAGFGKRLVPRASCLRWSRPTARECSRRLACPSWPCGCSSCCRGIRSITVGSVMNLVATTKPTARRAIALLTAARVLVETTGERRPGLMSTRGIAIGYAWGRACVMTDPPKPQVLAEGARLFDAGQHFDAHEVWEERWRATTDETERRFLQGLIQVAAAFHKHSTESALRLLGKALVKLQACPDRFADFDLATFRTAIARCADRLARGQFELADVPQMSPLLRRQAPTIV
jgi:predicted metal-dependent hydrolase